MRRTRSIISGVVIDDNANQPLTIQSIEVELTPQPWIYFEADGAGTYTAIYGDAKAEALERVGGKIGVGQVAQELVDLAVDREHPLHRR